MAQKQMARSTFLATSAALGAALTVPLRAAAQGAPVRPFMVHIPEVELVEMRRRITAVRWPDRETVTDLSQGVPLATIQYLAQHWATEYDWRKCEARLNALPQFVTEIDGLDIYFIHVRSKHAGAMPLIMTHGWPGSVLEFMDVIGTLTDPTAYGGNASDAFHLVVPSIPGFGFSGKPAVTGWDPEHIARAWVVLMKRLGYSRFASQGGDWGGIITNVMGKQAPPELLGIHVNFPATIPASVSKALRCGDPPATDFSVEEKEAYLQLVELYSKHVAYSMIMATRPQTLYELADSPVGLATWLLDHGDRYSQPASPFVSAVAGQTVNGHPAGAITRDALLDNATLYWVTNTGVSSSRIYWESHVSPFGALGVSVPAAVSVFPGESYQAPQSWAQRAYLDLIYYNKVAAGGHFAAWEQPELFTDEVRAGLRPLRKQ